MRLPNWAIKPKHTKELIATNKGWEVKETGELLVRVRGLDVLLKQLEKQTDFVVEVEEDSTMEVDIEATTDAVDEQQEAVLKEEVKEEPVKEQLVETNPAPVKRRGRQTKAK
jgi:hypothetical protein